MKAKARDRYVFDGPRWSNALIVVGALAFAVGTPWVVLWCLVFLLQFAD